MRFHEYRTLWSEMQGRLPSQVTKQWMLDRKLRPSIDYYWFHNWG